MQTVIYVVLPVIGIFLGWIIRWFYAKFQLSAVEQRAERIKQDAQREAEAAKKEILLEAKEQQLRERNQQEKENRERRSELQRQERRLEQKEESLDARTKTLDEQEKGFVKREQSISKRENELTDIEETYRRELEKVSGLSQEEAKALIIKDLEEEARHDAQGLIAKIEQEANQTAEKKARSILLATIQRMASETTNDVTIATVSLPSDEMKGRIIGREGRNIRALETLTGVDVVIDDTPEVVVIACFDPVRRAIAKIALERLVLDGRIHPARVEEIVQKVTHDVNQKVMEEGEQVLYDLGIHGMSPEGIRALGALHFRTSYGQNVLQHSKEVAQLASMLAAEVGADRDLAKRAGLLHDIGKGAKNDSDQNHAEIGMEMARKMGENPVVINAIGSHHNDVEPTSPVAILVQIADAISAARPGARCESLDNYVKRLENLENIAESYDGVEKAYAIQAGREIRILVNNEKVADGEIQELARKIAKQIETDLKYPGRIKMTMIRETRLVEYAR